MKSTIFEMVMKHRRFVRLYADNIEFIINHPEWKLNKTLKRYADLETRDKNSAFTLMRK